MAQTLDKDKTLNTLKGCAFRCMHTLSVRSRFKVYFGILVVPQVLSAEINIFNENERLLVVLSLLVTVNTALGLHGIDFIH